MNDELVARKGVDPELVRAERARRRGRLMVTRRTFLITRALMVGDGVDLFTAIEAVSSTAIEHPEWDMSEERSWSEWERLETGRTSGS